MAIRIKSYDKESINVKSRDNIFKMAAPCNATNENIYVFSELPEPNYCKLLQQLDTQKKSNWS